MNDVSLFIKCLVADGIAPRIRLVNLLLYVSILFYCFFWVVLHQDITKDNVKCFLEAVESGWQPTMEHCGAAAREVLGCISWKGKQNSLAFVKHIAAKSVA